MPITYPNTTHTKMVQAKNQPVDIPQDSIATDYVFINRILSVPLVNKSLAVYNDQVLPLMEKNPVTNYVLKTATNVTQTVSKPLLDTIEPYHETLDSYGNRVLDVAAVGYTRVAGVEKVVSTQLDNAVKNIENVVNWVLPPSEEEKIVQQANGTSEPAPFLHAYQLTQKTGHRLYEVVSSRSQKAIYTTEELLHVKATLEILSQYQAHLEKSVGKLKETVSSTQQFLASNPIVQNSQQAVEDMKTFVNNKREQYAKPTFEAVMATQARLLEATTELRTTVQHSVSAMIAKAPSLPFGLQSRFNELVQAFQKRFEEASSALAHTKFAKDVSVESLMQNLKDLSQKSLSLATLSDEAIEVITGAKKMIGNYFHKEEKKTQ